MKQTPDLEKITQEFITATGLVPLVAAEIEFYSTSNLQPTTINQQLAEANIETYGLEEERGENQYELALKNPTTPHHAAQQIETIKQLFLEANFAAKPYPDQPGSGLHIHLSLHDTDGVNLFAKKGDEDETAIMRHCIAGLLDSMLKFFYIFAPNPESYARFSAALLREGVYNNAPINVSWGGNNRTTAIRIPASTAYPNGRHIEHRVSGADANPHKVIAAILEGAKQGLLNKQEPPAKIWGDAADKQYSHLIPFPKTLEEASGFI